MNCLTEYSRHSRREEGNKWGKGCLEKSSWGKTTSPPRPALEAVGRDYLHWALDGSWIQLEVKGSAVLKVKLQ